MICTSTYQPFHHAFQQEINHVPNAVHTERLRYNVLRLITRLLTLLREHLGISYGHDVGPPQAA